MRIRYGSIYNERRTFEQSEVLQNKKGEKIMTKRFGFTLAEVLITLGIIGVVAAMTMPTLMNQTNGAQYKASYKKALSAISQGITLNVALDGGSFADATAASTNTLTQPANSIGNYLVSRMNVVKASAESAKGWTISSPNTTTYPAPGNATTNTTLFFNDGSTFTFITADTGCTHGQVGGGDNVCKGYIDVNGAKGPNKVVSCSSGSGESCVAENPTDVYPVKFYDQTILPNSPAARAVLYGK